jgi:hypothetical protein
VIDSDKKSLNDDINATKKRVKEQAEKLGGLVWVTEGREIENYVPAKLLEDTAREGLNSSAGQFDKVITESSKVNKVDYARSVVALEWGDEWPLGLQESVNDLIGAIVRAG